MTGAGVATGGAATAALGGAGFTTAFAGLMGSGLASGVEGAIDRAIQGQSQSLSGSAMDIGLGMLSFGIADNIARRFSSASRRGAGEAADAAESTGGWGAFLASEADTIDNAVANINHNADVATELARRARARGRKGVTDSGFGTFAHKKFEKLNGRLNRRLEAQGSQFSVTAEQYRNIAGDPVAKRAKGSIGADVFVSNRHSGVMQRLFDLKTHGGVERMISESRQTLFLQRFGMRAEEIFRRR